MTLIAGTVPAHAEQATPVPPKPAMIFNINYVAEPIDTRIFLLPHNCNCDRFYSVVNPDYRNLNSVQAFATEYTIFYATGTTFTTLGTLHVAAIMDSAGTLQVSLSAQNAKRDPVPASLLGISARCDRPNPVGAPTTFDLDITFDAPPLASNTNTQSEACTIAPTANPR